MTSGMDQTVETPASELTDYWTNGVNLPFLIGGNSLASPSPGRIELLSSSSSSSSLLLVAGGFTLRGDSPTDGFLGFSLLKNSNPVTSWSLLLQQSPASGFASSFSSLVPVVQNDSISMFAEGIPSAGFNGAVNQTWGAVLYPNASYTVISSGSSSSQSLSDDDVETEVVAYWSGGTVETDDSHVVFSNATGRISVSTSGNFFVTYSVVIHYDDPFDYAQSWIARNGNFTAIGGFYKTRSNQRVLSSSAILNLSAGDFISIVVQAKGGTNNTLVSANGATTFSVMLVSNESCASTKSVSQAIIPDVDAQMVTGWTFGECNASIYETNQNSSITVLESGLYLAVMNLVWDRSDAYDISTYFSTGDGFTYGYTLRAENTLTGVGSITTTLIPLDAGATLSVFGHTSNTDSIIAASLLSTWTLVRVSDVTPIPPTPSTSPTAVVPFAIGIAIVALLLLILFFGMFSNAETNSTKPRYTRL